MKISHAFAVVVILAIVPSVQVAAKDPAARMAEIVGEPPRIAPLGASEATKEALAALNETRRKALNAPPLTELPEFSATFLRHPALYKAHGVMSVQLRAGELNARDRELAILRIGWLCQAPFEWGEHVKIAKRLGGVTDEEVTRITEGSSAPGWNEADRALLKAVEEMHADAMISDGTWAVLSKSQNEKQLIELPLLIGQYQGIAYLQNSLRVRLMAGNKGLVER